MAETEGVIKYTLEHDTQPLESKEHIKELNLWRSRLSALGLIGADPNRYEGFGFGNLSARTNADKFVITGSQTGLVERLNEEHYAEILSVELDRSFVRARGQTRPSSEALTHAALYQADNSIEFVFHVHSPEIWQAHAQLSAATTPKDAPYGTPEMAKSVNDALSTELARTSGLIVMLGHEDGVLSFGRSANEAGGRLVDALNRVLPKE